MATVYYKRAYSFYFPQSFLTQISSMLLYPGRYSYSVCTIEKKNFFGAKSYETTIELRDSENNFIKSKVISEDDVSEHAVIVSNDTLFFQSLIPECIDYLLNDLPEFINEDYWFFPPLDDVLYYNIKGYMIGDHLKTSGIFVKIPIKWEFGSNPKKEEVEKKLLRMEIAPLSGYYLCVEKSRAIILYDNEDKVVYAFPDPKRIFAMFCYMLMKTDKFLQFK